jgi:hypothetical protein
MKHIHLLEINQRGSCHQMLVVLRDPTVFTYVVGRDYGTIRRDCAYHCGLALMSINRYPALEEGHPLEQHALRA